MDAQQGAGEGRWLTHVPDLAGEWPWRRHLHNSALASPLVLPPISATRPLPLLRCAALCSAVQMIARLGQEINHPDSIYYWAWKNDIPVFCPALTGGCWHAGGAGLG